jgi:hypothetical protein
MTILSGDERELRLIQIFLAFVFPICTTLLLNILLTLRNYSVKVKYISTSPTDALL